MSRRRNIGQRIYRFLRYLYLKLFRINDSPQKVSLGLGLGVFLGVFPGVGPIASFFLAWLFRVNRASAVLGCLITNTWLSVVAFLLSLKVGALVMGRDWQSTRSAYESLTKDFHWADLLKTSAFEILLPVVIGYLLVALMSALVCYLIAHVALTRARRKRKQAIQ